MGRCICCKQNPANRDYCKGCARSIAINNRELTSQIRRLETACNNWRLKYFKLLDSRNKDASL